MKCMEGWRILCALRGPVLLLLLLPVPLRAQAGDAVAPVALDPATADLVPVRVELVRRGEVRIDPGTGALAGARPDAVGPAPLLAFDPASRALLAVDLVPVRMAGRIDVDPRTGAPSSQGLETPLQGTSPGGPVLVGYDQASGALAPMELALARQAGSFVLDPRVGVLSPPARDAAVVGYDPATGSLAPIEVRALPGRGGLELDPATGQMSFDPAAPGPDPGSLSLLGIAGDGTLYPVELEVVYRPGLLTVDPATGDFSFPGEPPADAGQGLTMIGVNLPTGALTRSTVEATRRPGAFTVDLRAGTVEQVAQPEPEAERAAGFAFGGGLDLRQMLKLQDVLEEGGVGGTGASATEIAPGIHGFAEYRWRFIALGVEAAYSVMDTEIRFPQGLQTGDLTYFEFGGNVKVLIPMEGSLTPYVTFAILRASSEADFELEGLTESRTYEAKRDGIGAGFDYWVTPRLGLRVEGLYNTTFEDSDAAEHLRWRVGATYSPDLDSVGPPPRGGGGGWRVPR